MGYTCTTCNKDYASYQSLWNHNRKYHTSEKLHLTSINCVTTTDNYQKRPKENQFDCIYCNKTFTRKNNLNYHLKNKCKEKEKKQNEHLIYMKHIEKLTQEIEKLKNKPKSKIINNYNGPVNNGPVNNGSITTIKLCEIGKEDLSHLTHSEKKYIMAQGMNSIISLIDHLNFSDHLKQNHTFYTSAINDKHVNTIDFKTKSVIKKSKKDLFDQILDSHINKLALLSNNNKKFTDVFNNIKAFIYLKNAKKEFITQLNMLSYNKRAMVINTWNTLIDDSTITPEEIPDRFEEEVKQIACMSEEECSEISTDYNSSSSDDESDSEERPVLFPNNKKHIIV